MCSQSQPRTHNFIENYTKITKKPCAVAQSFFDGKLTASYERRAAGTGSQFPRLRVSCESTPKRQN